MAVSRRGFIKASLAACALCAAGMSGAARAAYRPRFQLGLINKKESPFYLKLPDGFVRCTLCPHQCQVGPGERGACRVRQNIKGKYYSLVYGNPCAVHVDPIEKKPFFHVMPATRSFSVATAGCNFSCMFCQNWEISQQAPDDTMNLSLSPKQVVEQARDFGASSIASTYVEPTIFMEYMLDIGAEAKRSKLLNVMHSNGSVNPAPLAQLMKVLDAACIDLKSSQPTFYREICGGELAPVQKTLKTLVKNKVHTEIVHLMVTGLNTDPKHTAELIAFVRDELSPRVPVHFTRFYPRYKLNNVPPTPIETLNTARETALKMGLEYAYVGNVPGHPAENTYCPSCKRKIIERVGYSVRAVHLKQGCCAFCGRPIYGIWPGARIS